jgi:DNA mismatch repair protein MSH5
VNTTIHAGHAKALRLMNPESALFVAHELEKLLDEDMTEEETRELEEAEAIGRRFLAWDLNDETAMDQPPKEFVARILGMTNDD